MYLNRNKRTAIPGLTHGPTSLVSCPQKGPAPDLSEKGVRSLPRTTGNDMTMDRCLLKCGCWREASLSITQFNRLCRVKDQWAYFYIPIVYTYSPHTNVYPWVVTVLLICSNHFLIQLPIRIQYYSIADLVLGLIAHSYVGLHKKLATFDNIPPLLQLDTA